MVIHIFMGLALCGSMIFISRQKKIIRELRRFKLIKLITEHTSENLNIMKSMRDVNTMLLMELHEHLSDSTFFLQVDENTLSVLDSTIDDEMLERTLRDVNKFTHPEEADFQEAFANGAIRSIEEKNGVSLLYPTAVEREIKSAVMVPLIASGTCLGYWLIEHTGKLQNILDLNEVSILGRHIAMALALGLHTFTDPLMGIAKREFVIEKVEDLIREKKDFCLVFADIDHFKKVNDTYGHDIGDEVLKILAQVLKINVRDKDLIGRYGGEELLICMQDIKLEDAVHRLNDIRTQIASLELNMEEKPALQVTCSFGVASSTELENPDFERIIKLADNRVYSAKRSGRNKVVFS